MSWLSHTGKGSFGSWQGFRMVVVAHGHTWAVGTCRAIYTMWMVTSNILGAEGVSAAFMCPSKSLHASCGEKWRM